MTNDVPDAQAIAQLRASGVDATRPCELAHYIYFSSETDADPANQLLRSEGYSIELRPSATGEGWLSLVKHTIIPTSEAITSVREHLSELAAAHGGEYDGWEVRIEANTASPDPPEATRLAEARLS